MVHPMAVSDFTKKKAVLEHQAMFSHEFSNFAFLLTFPPECPVYITSFLFIFTPCIFQLLVVYMGWLTAATFLSELHIGHLYILILFLFSFSFIGSWGVLFGSG